MYGNIIIEDMIKDGKISKEVYKKLLSFESVIRSDCIITGGHFMLRGDQKLGLNDGTKLSLQVATELFSKLVNKKKNIKLGMLINNIGSTCDLNICYTSSSSKFIFPEEYTKMLKENNLELNDLLIFWEKHLRNRGKKEFIKRVRKIDNIEENEEGWWLKEKTGKNFILTRRALKDPYGTPACPLIVAAYALEQERKGFKSSLNYWYVDSDNFENIPNHFMIEKGYEVAKMFDVKIKVMNVYFTKDKVITNF